MFRDANYFLLITNYSLSDNYKNKSFKGSMGWSIWQTPVVYARHIGRKAMSVDF